MSKGKRILFIGDSHAKPGVPNRRYTWAARVACHYGVDQIVCAGDWWDMESLCSYDRGTKGFEGRRYQADVDAGIDAMERMAAVFEKEGFWPKLHRTMGNHENRINRYLEAESVLDGGPIGLQNLNQEDYGWSSSPFLTPKLIGGVAFCHYFTSGVMNRPIGGENHAASLVKKGYHSCAVGHSHLKDYWETTDVLGQRMIGLVGGCYFEHDEGYAGPTNRRYARGLNILDSCADGVYDYSWLDLDTIRNRFGSRAAKYKARS